MGKKGILNYDLRTFKQIERKLIIELLNELRFLKYPISKYRYIGMPSLFYYDFILFYKYLYIKDMIGFESKDIPKRMELNKPYDFIKIKIGDFSKTYKESYFNKKTILWLDYTTHLDENKLNDIGNITGGMFKPGSVIIVTLPVDVPIEISDPKNKLHKKLKSLGHRLIMDGEVSEIKTISGNNLSKIYQKSIKACIEEALLRQNKYSGLPLFSITYDDGGCKMVSMGFIIDRKTKIDKVNTYLTKNKSEIFFGLVGEYDIDIPNPITYKERKIFEQQLNGIKSALEKEIESNKIAPGGKLLDKYGLEKNYISKIINLEIDNEDFISYFQHHRHYPNYHEGIL